jgi:hypothetical protein
MKRTHYRKIILLCGSIAFVVSGLFPPWLYVTDEGHTYAAGCSFILTPPEKQVFLRNPLGPDTYEKENSRLDASRLTVEWLCITVGTGICWFLISKSKTETEKDSKDKDL